MFICPCCKNQLLQLNNGFCPYCNSYIGNLSNQQVPQYNTNNNIASYNDYTQMYENPMYQNDELIGNNYVSILQEFAPSDKEDYIEKLKNFEKNNIFSFNIKGVALFSSFFQSRMYVEAAISTIVFIAILALLTVNTILCSLFFLIYLLVHLFLFDYIHYSFLTSKLKTLKCNRKHWGELNEAQIKKINKIKSTNFMIVVILLTMLISCFFYLISFFSVLFIALT